MIGRLLWLTTGLLLALASHVQAQTKDIPYSQIEALVEIHGGPPYVGEPLRLVIRSAIHAQVASDRIIQPDLTDFDWQQFGVDSTSEEFIDGFWMPVVTRVLMIYPLLSGRLTIGSFKRHITYFDPNGDRKETEISSAPVSIDVQSRDSITGQDNYWIPAKNIRITDMWDPEPDNIGFEETTQRTITVEAEGLTADRLPNLPSLRAPGIITFAGPVKRETIITDQGPIGRIVYRWRIRPVSQSVATAPPVKIRWFDVTQRQMRESVIPERLVAFSSSLYKRESNKSITNSYYLSSKSIIAFLLALTMTGAVSFLFFSYRLNNIAHRRRLISSLGLFGRLFLTAWHDDDMKFYSIVKKLQKIDPPLWRMIELDREYSCMIEALEAVIYDNRPTCKSDGLIGQAFAIFKIYIKTQSQISCYEMPGAR